jgi:hypothetical protein
MTFKEIVLEYKIPTQDHIAVTQSLLIAINAVLGNGDAKIIVYAEKSDNTNTNTGSNNFFVYIRSSQKLVNIEEKLKFQNVTPNNVDLVGRKFNGLSILHQFAQMLGGTSERVSVATTGNIKVEIVGSIAGNDRVVTIDNETFQVNTTVRTQ